MRIVYSFRGFVEKSINKNILLHPDQTKNMAGVLLKMLFTKISTVLFESELIIVF